MDVRTDFVQEEPLGHHDFGHLCRGSHISGHSDFGMLSNFKTSSIFTSV